MINKQKVNKIVGLIGFLSLNLQRKIQNIEVMKRSNIKVMKRSLIVGTYLLSLVCSCASEGTLDNGKPLSLMEDSKNMVEMAQLFTPLSMVALDEKQSDKLKWISKIDYVNGRYYVLGGLERGKLITFDSKGKFLMDIGDIGHASGEYVQASDFAIDKANNRIAILEAPNKVLLYDMNGKFLFEKYFKKISFWNIAWNNNEYILSTNNFGIQEKDKLLYVYDENFNLKNSYVDNLPYTIGMSNVLATPLQVDGNDVNYIDPVTKGIYTYKSKVADAQRTYKWLLPNPMPDKDYVHYKTFAENQYRYDFILDAVVDENRILTSYKRGDYMFVNLMTRSGMSKTFGHIDVSLPKLIKGSGRYVFLAIRGREYLKDKAYFTKYKKGINNNDGYLIFKCKLK